MNPTITLVTLGVTAIDDSIRFYRDGLGFPMLNREDESDVAFFPLDGARLPLYQRTLLAEDANVASEGGGFSGVTLAHDVSTKGVVDGILEEAEAAGGRLLKSARDALWSGYSGYFADPDDHPWEVAYPQLTDE